MSQPWFDYPTSHGYITQFLGAGTDTPHYANDIATPFHTPITALESGVVDHFAYTPWGSELFVKPDAGGPDYYYYHLDEIDVQPKQHLAAGQFVGLSGGENPGFPGAEHPTLPKYSSGPHTHVGFYTQSVVTPIGTEPFGPDISPLIAQLRSGGLGQPISTNNSTQQASFFGQQLNLGQSVSSFFTADVLWRGGSIIIGLILVLMGIKHFLSSGTTINVQEPKEEPEEEITGKYVSEGKETPYEIYKETK